MRRELEDVGATGQRALARVRDASQPASKGLLAVDTASREVQASLNRFAGQLGPVGRGLTALGPAGLAAGAAIGGVVLALRQGLDAAAEAEQRMFRLEGVLRGPRPRGRGREPRFRVVARRSRGATGSCG